ncbi:MAG TPA: PDZ domain-containing protein, partial [Thermoguttaceae bacterium]|nr:PDZ domain-containing protein [Thermoguttaceae bacterium]
TAAARAEPILLPGDKIVKIDGVPVKTGPAVDEALSARRDRPIEITIERKKGRDKPAEELLIHVVPRPMRDLGLVMEMGPVTAIQKGSPAALAGLKPGDRLTALDGSPVGDPLTLGDRLWKQVERAAADGKSPPTVTLTVERAETLDVPVTLKGLQPRDCIVAVDNHSLENQKISVDPLWARVNRALAKGESVPEVTLTVKRRHKLELPVALRRTNAFETPSLSSANGPVSVPSLGVAYKIGNKVAEVVPGGPAAAAGVVPGDVLTAVTIPKPDDALVEREGLKSGDVEEAEFDLKKYPFDWPRVFTNMQMMLPGSKVELTFAKGKKAVLEPVADDDWFNPERGFRFAPLEFKQTAHSFGEALRLGGAETWEQSTVVLRTVQRLASGDLSMKLVGGPITIAQVAGAKASAGLSDFLIFLTMISSMLAVVNFLPIPILDGGHFVFLLYEGIRRKPVSERVQLALSYVGLLLILALMFWALGLDTKLIPRE